jgi:hypothetical protein
LLGGESDGDHRGCVNCRHYRHRVERLVTLSGRFVRCHPSRRTHR